MRTAIVLLAAALCGGCAGSAERGEMRYYLCDDGSAFNLELRARTVRLHTVTGAIELQRTRSDEGALYTNGLRSVLLLPDGSARHAVGRRAWVDCTTA